MHVHSCFSLLDGLPQPDDIANRVNELDLPGCAITDHGSISSSIQILKAMKEVDKKPILGCELYVCEHDSKIKDESNRALSHLLVYAKNDAGWVELMQLVSKMNDPLSYYYKPRLSLNEIADCGYTNLIFASGHLGSTLSSVIFNANGNIHPDAIFRGCRQTEWLREAVGKENFFLECQLIDAELNPETKILTDIVREIGEKTGVPIIATPDAHYCRKEDAELQRILLCRNLGSKTIEEVVKSGAMACFFKSDKYHIPSYEEMIEAGHTEEELDNTLLAASQVNEYENILKSPQLPCFSCPSGYNDNEWVRKLCRDGWREKIKDVIPEADQEEYVERVKYELDVIQNAGLSSYFLIVKDILDFCRSKGWLVGVARGSSAGCLVSYLLNITGIDPIPYDLIFERFYNSARSGSMPDIDIDVPSSKRDEIIQYMKDKYGHDRVSQMITLQSLHARSCIQNVLKAHGHTQDEINEITKLFPQEASISDDLQEMLDQQGESSSVLWSIQNDSRGRFKEWVWWNDETDSLEGPLASRFYDSISLENIKIGQGKHAAGVVIAPYELSKFCPMAYDSKNKNLIAGLEMKDLEAIGGIKFDILSLSLLDKIDGVCKILENGDTEYND